MSITPYLLYEDVAGALKFLAKAFGFRKYGTQMSGPDGKINHAAMQLGDDLIMMGYPGLNIKIQNGSVRRPRAFTSMWTTWMNTSSGQGRQAQRSSKTPKIRSTVIAATVPRIPKDISGTSRRRSVNVRNPKKLRRKKG